MDILIVGGAGYIGSVTNHLLLEQGFQTTVLDNLSRGHLASVPKGSSFIEGDFSDPDLLKEMFASKKFDAVMHFAALSLVGESVSNPLLYYKNNVANTIVLFNEMEKAGIENFIFSSTAAVYGNPHKVPIEESHPIQPINPYGWSKSMVEQVLRDAIPTKKIRYVSLRYFNAAGALPDGSLGEHHEQETHLIPLVLQTLLDPKSDRILKVFGTDYGTPDGTCIRDYIHVLDLAEAHILGLKYLQNGGQSDIFNLGNGKGFSVREVIETAEKVTGKKVPFEETDRRPGDPPVLVANSTKINQVLKWKPKFPELGSIIETAWKWHSLNPNGYSN